MKSKELPYEDEMKKFGFALKPFGYEKRYEDGSHWTVSVDLSEVPAPKSKTAPVPTLVPTKQGQKVSVEFFDKEGRSLAALDCTFGAILTKTVVLDHPVRGVLVPNPKPHKEKKRR